jgi:molecular chaperone GrpE
MSKHTDQAAEPGEELTQLQQQLEAEKHAKLLALADLDNYRKRMEKERGELIITANLSVFKSLIDLVDDFERLIEDLEKPNEEDPIDAFKTLLGKAKGILADYGVTELKVEIGDKLNPQQMEAIGTVAVEKEDEHNTIKHIAQKGYWLSNRELIVRPVRVIVGLKK